MRTIRTRSTPEEGQDRLLTLSPQGMQVNAANVALAHLPLLGTKRRGWDARIKRWQGGATQGDEKGGPRPKVSGSQANPPFGAAEFEPQEANEEHRSGTAGA